MEQQRPRLGERRKLSYLKAKLQLYATGSWLACTTNGRHTCSVKSGGLSQKYGLLDADCIQVAGISIIFSAFDSYSSHSGPVHATLNKRIL